MLTTCRRAKSGAFGFSIKALIANENPQLEKPNRPGLNVGPEQCGRPQQLLAAPMFKMRQHQGHVGWRDAADPTGLGDAYRLHSR